MSILISILAELLKDSLPQVLEFIWSKAHDAQTTIEDAADDAQTDALRSRLLAAIADARAARDGGASADPSGSGARL